MIKPWWAEDPDGAESFEREAQLLARVSDPGIVQIFDVGQAEEGLYFVTELVDGESLAARLKRSGPIAAPEACEIAEQLCRALAHAHAERIVHRDIKPANVLISGRGQVKVGDLGIARLAEGSTDGGTATIVGTPRYMAPEQASGLPVTPATDVYSAGVVLYEMLAGRTPFGGESAVEIALQHVQMEPPPLPPGTPRSLERVVRRALAKDPADRYQSAAEMGGALARARGRARARRERDRYTGVEPRVVPDADRGRRGHDRDLRERHAHAPAGRDRPDSPRAADEPAPDRQPGRAPAQRRRVRVRAARARVDAGGGEGADRAGDRGAPAAPRADRETGDREAEPHPPARHVRAPIQPRPTGYGVRAEPLGRRAGEGLLDGQRHDQQGAGPDQGAAAHRAERDQRQLDAAATSA